MTAQNNIITAQCDDLQQVISTFKQLLLESYKRDTDLTLVISIPRGGVVRANRPPPKCLYIHEKGRYKGQSCIHDSTFGSTYCKNHSRMFDYVNVSRETSTITPQYGIPV